MRDELVGYLLEALDDEQRQRVDVALADAVTGPPLRKDLDRLRRAATVLEADAGTERPPEGLARRTLRFIENHREDGRRLRPHAPAAGGPLPRPRIFSEERVPPRVRSPRVWIDRAILAATAIAASVLLIPLVLDGIDQSRSLRTQRNVQSIAGGLAGYSEHHRRFPTPPDSGPLSRAGLYAPTLVSEHRLRADDGTFLVPGSDLAKRSLVIPSLDEVKRAAAAGDAEAFDRMVRSMGGDFGYTLGHRDAAGRLQPLVNLGRAHHPILADAPDDDGHWSGNHPRRTHHVLYEDGHVERIGPHALHIDDHLYRNHRGEVRAGVDAEDAVIGDSHHQP